MKNIKKLAKDQRGAATLVISILIILLLTLIVLAMSRNAMREQRQALDRQLNSQAFYAAESGINDTIEYALTNDSVPADKEQCAQQDGFPSTEQMELDSEGPVVYSCLLYDKTPTSLVKDVDTDHSWIVPIMSEDNGVQSLTISWNEQGLGDSDSINCSGVNTSTFRTNQDYRNTHPDCRAGFLKVELIDTTDITAGNPREELIKDNFIAYFVPGNGSGSGTVSHNAGIGKTNQGVVSQARCDTDNKPRKCKLTITGVNLPQNQQSFLRVSSIYKSNTVEVEGARVGGGQIQFVGAQMKIDSTGKAADVLKRLQVRVPINAQSQYEYPEYAIASDICKRLGVLPPPHNSESENECN